MLKPRAGVADFEPAAHSLTHGSSTRPLASLRGKEVGQHALQFIFQTAQADTSCRSFHAQHCQGS